MNNTACWLFGLVVVGAISDAAEASQDPRVLVNQAVTFARRGRWSEALTIVREAVQSAPGLAVAHHNLGAVLAQRGAYEEVQEAAAVLEMSVANVKTTHHRARRALLRYDRARRPPTAACQRETLDVLQRFLACLSTGDKKGLESMLSAGVRTFTDAGGAFVAALRPVVGTANVARLYLARAVRMGPPSHIEITMLNGLPTAVLEWWPAIPARAPRAVLRCLLDERGAIRELLTVLAPPKLTSVGGARP